MKTKEELKQIKEEYTNLSNKLAELSEDELKQVTGGTMTTEEKQRALKKRQRMNCLLRSRNILRNL